ncbi:CD151 antigen-like [Macrosteles quadrilineatus]|uniref:CD151 antigen-like n=1 Tax=Macrosteles quadrilineatus TaxID=74068 RepID=UPI0023E0F538|nr:CD151 antigen-like [Macrosteles quadrilineatus]
MFCASIDLSIIALILANLVFMGGGLGLVFSGGLLLEDTERILTSRLILTSLTEPLFYYIALSLMMLGLILTALSVLGCWAAHLDNYCVLSFYLFSLLLLLVGESVVGVLALLCPQYLGLTLDREMLQDNWQRTYGVPGREQYTAAIDLVQTQLQCCGVESGNDFTASWWRLRELAPASLVVPLSCCVQQHPVAFLDPRPVNTSLCQHEDVEQYRLARSVEGCFNKLSSWLQSHISLGLTAGLALLSLQLLLLLLTVVSCVKRAQAPAPPPALPPKLLNKVHNSFPYSGS